MLAQIVQGAYYVAYWNNAKNPRSLQDVLKSIYRDPNAPKPDPDIKTFEERERRLRERGGHTKANENS